MLRLKSLADVIVTVSPRIVPDELMLPSRLSMLMAPFFIGDVAGNVKILVNVLEALRHQHRKRS